jgi:hypothetical protein
MGSEGWTALEEEEAELTDRVMEDDAVGRTTLVAACCSTHSIPEALWRLLAYNTTDSAFAVLLSSKFA